MRKINKITDCTVRGYNFWFTVFGISVGVCRGSENNILRFKSLVIQRSKPIRLTYLFQVKTKPVKAY